MTATAEVPFVADDESNHFRLWMKSMGYNAKQVTQAGEAFGMPSAMAGRTARSERELTDTERFAMSAATAGLPAWTPDTASEIEAIRTLYTVLKSELAQVKAGAGPESDAVRTIRAVIRSEAHRLASEAQADRSAEPEMDQAILALLRAVAKGTSAR